MGHAFEICNFGVLLSFHNDVLQPPPSLNHLPPLARSGVLPIAWTSHLFSISILLFLINLNIKLTSILVSLSTSLSFDIDDLIN